MASQKPSAFSTGVFTGDVILCFMFYVLFYVIYVILQLLHLTVITFLLAPFQPVPVSDVPRVYPGFKVRIAGTTL